MRKILIVEDEALVAEDLKECLINMGHEVTACVTDNGAALFEVINNTPDLILMDINLAGEINGIETAKNILLHQDIPIIFITGFVDGYLEDAKKINPYGYIVKPFRMHDVQINIDLALYKHAIKRKLTESEKKYRNLVETTNTGYLILDSNGNVADANQKYVKLSGHTELSEILGRSVLEWTAEHAKKLNKEAISACLKNGFINNFEVDYINNKTQIITPIEINATVQGQGNTMRIISICRDITERKQSEELFKLNSIRQKALLTIFEKSDASTTELLDIALEESLKITKSKIGNIYFYNEDEELFTLYSWSTEVSDKCKLQEKKTTFLLKDTKLCGEAIRQRKTIIINDFTAPNTLINGIPEGHVALTRYMNIPVFDNKKIVFAVGVANKETNYDDNDIIQITLLMEGLLNVIKRKEVEEKLKLEQLKSTSALIDGQEAERKRLSAEIHDSIGQKLVALKMKLENINTKDSVAAQMISESKQILSNTIEEVRTISHNLMPQIISELGIEDALNNLCHTMQKDTFMKIDFVANLKKDILNEKVRTYLYRIAQESLNNCLKHSLATEVNVFLFGNGEYIKMIITDNGVGFNPAQSHDGIGLKSINERVMLLSGEVVINSKKGDGTTIIVKIPDK